MKSFFKWSMCLYAALCMGCMHMPMLQPPPEPPIGIKEVEVLSEEMHFTLEAQGDEEMVFLMYGETADMGNFSKRIGPKSTEKVSVIGLRPCTMTYFRVVRQDKKGVDASPLFKIRTSPPHFVTGDSPPECP